MNRDRLYQLKEVMKIVGETRQRIQYWYLNGLIQPYDPGSGTGTARGFSFNNLMEIEIIRHLAATTINISSIKFILSTTQGAAPELFESTPLSLKDMGSHKVLVIEFFNKKGTTLISGVMTLQDVEANIKDMLSEGRTLLSVDLSVIKANLIVKLDRA